MLLQFVNVLTYLLSYLAWLIRQLVNHWSPDQYLLIPLYYWHWTKTKGISYQCGL